MWTTETLERFSLLHGQNTLVTEEVKYSCESPGILEYFQNTGAFQSFTGVFWSQSTHVKD